eukprot:TRINITY_DN4327_c0_g1_i1.p1 TRINITY_DN4327_c0_g1~~TRINITY_DN4327_c0_g1_i1.p1  ORF type:complete len:384 (+),score=56.47 TRINITY_DN4327_c0_g1_i1:56-1153(+)
MKSLFVLLPALFVLIGCADGYSDVVQRLKNMIDAEPELEIEFRTMFVQSGHPDQTKEHMYQFFDVWLTFLPQIIPSGRFTHFTTASYYYLREDQTPIDAGVAVVTNNMFSSWITSFISSRGEFLSSPASLPAVPIWIESGLVNMSDFVVPPGGYSSFNDFFCRLLAPGVRPIDQNAVVVSPVDGGLGALSQGVSLRYCTPDNTTVVAKGRLTTYERMLGGHAEQFPLNRTMSLVAGLGVANYHGLHSPVDGTIVSVDVFRSLLYPYSFHTFFEELHRGVVVFESPTIGKVALVMIGIDEISSIKVLCKPGQIVKKGDRLAYFAFGGSTSIVLWNGERAAFAPDVERRIANNSDVQLGTALAVSRD